ncbi:hypothetical protein POJ06DRAFT_45439 [Lipomyces tetrasporus]|uniref:AAA+ ATPase domain-containing protein n=1 Tax=Lipomyces tetrasporus TaxID=54092 RepID=A0AAD7QL71_9ASCO|nr:uncharacterized protein POJ06DRAFT_45439 [Lipomyces tetrasporus]KAJ8096861.1 hypothetical protein POJ06DRAFT_45439 [Lipomyces tetrasporus]
MSRTVVFPARRVGPMRLQCSPCLRSSKKGARQACKPLSAANIVFNSPLISVARFSSSVREQKSVFDYFERNLSVQIEEKKTLKEEEKRKRQDDEDDEADEEEGDEQSLLDEREKKKSNEKKQSVISTQPEKDVTVDDSTDDYGHIPFTLSEAALERIEKNNIILLEKLKTRSANKLQVADFKTERPSGKTAYALDERIWRYLNTNVVSALDLAHTSAQTSPWADKYGISLLASSGQSLQYLDALVEKIAVEHGADILRIDNVDIERIIGEHIETTEDVKMLPWVVSMSNHVDYRYRNVDSLTSTAPADASHRQQHDDDEEDKAFSDDLYAKRSEFFGEHVTELLAAATPESCAIESDNCFRIRPKDRPLIVHVRDYLAMAQSDLGGTFFSELKHHIRQRRCDGEPAIIVATAHKPVKSSDSNLKIRLTADEDAGGLFISPDYSDDGEVAEPWYQNYQDWEVIRQSIPLSKVTYNPNAAIENISHIRTVNARFLDVFLCRVLESQPETVLEFPENWDLEQDSSKSQGLRLLSSGLLTPRFMYRLVMMLKGLMVQEDRTAVDMDLLDRAVAIHEETRDLEDLLQQNPNEYGLAQTYKDPYTITDINASTKEEPAKLDENNPTQSVKLRDWKLIEASLDKREKAFFNQYIKPETINVTFDNVIAPPRTLDVIRDTVMFPLLMPDEFSYGVLATNHTSGILLYGPSGTGKTLLVKALAKAGQTAILDVRPSDLQDKYVGEAEKNVSALFSLAKKLSPCIIFMDEVDSLMQNRGVIRDREMINQFMAEWDGLRSERIMVIGTTNRPFDLDDAVLRRFPRRVLVDLPTEINREEIFRVHLNGETLDDTVTPAYLAKKTAYFSGSDIKNVCVIAATEAVKQRRNNPALANASPKRVLSRRHFETALRETGASVSDEMSSLTMIREWHKQFGQDGKRAYKSGFGFSARPVETHVGLNQ